MKTIARTALLDLLIGATVCSMCQAGDPVSMSAPVSGSAGTPIIAPVTPTSANTSPFADDSSSMPGLPPAPAPPASPIMNGQTVPPGATMRQPSSQSSASQSGKVQLSDSPGGNNAANAPSDQPPGNVAYDSMNGQASASDSIGSANVEPFGPRFYLNGYFGDAPGWSGPSYQADLYYPWHVVPGRSVFLGVLQAAVDDSGKGYFNSGIGYREYFPDQDRILGAFGWLDWDDTNNAGWLRLGGSLESLGKYLDVRANWYVLADQGAATLGQSFTGGPVFQGTNIVLNQRTVTEDAFDGFDLEFGGLLPFLGRYGVSGYVGPYYLHSDSTGSAWGIEGRVNVAVTDNFQVNVTMQHDNVFDTTTFVNLSLMLPDGLPTKWFKPQSVCDRLGSMVIRRDRIPVSEEVSNEGIPFLNPPGTTPGNPTNTHGDLPIEVLHVDPNLPTGSGNGTAEHPFGSLEQARLANNAGITIIDIEPRTDGSGTNLMTNGIFQLFNYQHVWGTTIPHTIDTTAGMITIPAGNPGQPLPLVSNGAITANSAVFGLASVDEISGLHISGENRAGTAYGNGIANPAGPIVDFNINQNQFTDYQNAVFLMNAFGDGSSLHLNSNVISGNTATGTSTVSQNGFEIINTNPGTLNVTISGNTATGNSGDGFFVETAGAGTVINAAFTNNTANANGTTGIHVESTGGTTNVYQFTDNTVTNNKGNGVWLDAQTQAGGGVINVADFQGNTITGNGTAAVGPIGSDPDGLLISAQGTTAIVNAAIGVLNGAANNISNNGASGIGGAGIHVFVDGEGTILGSIVNNTITDNVSFGINVDALEGKIGMIGTSPTMAGAMPYIINTNTISGNGDAGIFARLQNDSQVGLQIINNSILDSTNGPNPLAAGEGIHIRTEGTSFLWDADIEHNFIGIGSNGSAGPNISHGIEFETFGNSRLADTVLYPGLSLVKIIDNLIEFNGGDGINFQRNGDSVVNDVLVQGNTSRYNVANGIDLIMNGGDIDISNGGGPLVINFTIISNNFSNNGINGAVFDSTGDAALRVVLGGTPTTGNVIDNNGQDGVNSSTLYFSQVEGTWSYNTIDNNGRDGIRLTDQDESGTSFSLTIADNQIEGNLADGIFYNSVTVVNIITPFLGGGDGTVNIVDNLIKKNGGNGVNVEPTGTAVANINLTDNQIIYNTLDGVRMQADEFAVITTNSSGNTITNNGADGWQLTTQAGSDASTLNGNGIISATLTDNIISFNGGRGIDILNQWNGLMNIDIEGTVNPTTTSNPSLDTNVVDSNGLQGILIENAADLTLTQRDPLNYFTGNNASPILQVAVNQTEISGNGTAAIAPDDGDGILINVGTSQFGYVNASITNNHFSGNANIDFVTQSIVATAQPTVTNLYNPTNGSINTAFEPDPLARLALHLTGNVGDNIDVTRTGAFYGGSSQPADNNKTIPGTWNGTDNQGDATFTYTFVAADETRRRNAQREPGVFYQQFPNDSTVSIDGGALVIGGIWDTQATLANPGNPSANNNLQYTNETPPTYPSYTTTPNAVAATPAPTTTTFGAADPMITNSGDYVHAYVTFILPNPGPNAFPAQGIRIITATTNTNQQITVGQAYPVAPVPGNTFAVTASELAGTGQSTFVTDSGPMVSTYNHFGTVITDFTTQVGFVAPNQTPAESDFPYGWRTVPLGSFGSSFP